MAGHRFSLNNQSGRKIAETGLRTAPHIAHTPPGRVVVFTARRRVWSGKKRLRGQGRVANPGRRVWLSTWQRDPPMDCVMPKMLDLYRASPRISSGTVPLVLSWPSRIRGPLPSFARFSRRLGDKKRVRGGGSCGVETRGVFRGVRPVPALTPDW